MGDNAKSDIRDGFVSLLSVLSQVGYHPAQEKTAIIELDARSGKIGKGRS